MILYINGDSYSAPNQSFKVYSNFLEEKIGLPVVNNASRGASNDRIIRTTLEYVSSLDTQTKPFVIVGFSFITREEIWINNTSEYQDRINDYVGSQFITLDWLQDKDITDDIKHLFIDQNINKQTIHFYTKLFMLSQTLKSLDVPYLFFSAADNADFKNLNWDSLNNLTMFNKIKQDPNIIDFKTFNIPLWASQNNIPTMPSGHLLENGHKLFSSFLFEKIYDTLR